MTDIRELLAQNLKKFRLENGFSQEKLAEKAEISTHYMGMIEQKRNFPTPEIIHRLAEALKIDTPDLFALQVPTNRASDLKRLQRIVLRDIKINIESSLSSTVNQFLGATEQVLEKAVAESIACHSNDLDDPADYKLPAQ
jgi:transcriptional regulator with XRE-family HTH domain